MSQLDKFLDYVRSEEERKTFKKNGHLKDC